MGESGFRKGVGVVDIDIDNADQAAGAPHPVTRR
jgi:hypothetical protein